MKLLCNIVNGLTAALAVAEALFAAGLIPDNIWNWILTGVGVFNLVVININPEKVLPTPGGETES